MKRGLPIPSLLLELIERGRWPADDEQARRFEMAYPANRQGDNPETQDWRLREYGLPRVPLDRIRLIHPTAFSLCLYPPPFRTSINWRVREVPGYERFFAEDEIDHNRMKGLGDFGHGSDTPIILDYQKDSESPTVRRLDLRRVRPTSEGQRGYWDSHWVEIARSFDEFADLLGFT